VEVTLTLPGFEESLRRIVREEMAALQDGGGPWFDAKGAAAYLGIGVPSVHNLVTAGRLPRYGEKGERLRFRRADLDAYQEGRR
jgi:excisionase family DNA binding protein